MFRAKLKLLAVAVGIALLGLPMLYNGFDRQSLSTSFSSDVHDGGDVQLLLDIEKEGDELHNVSTRNMQTISEKRARLSMMLQWAMREKDASSLLDAMNLTAVVPDLPPATSIDLTKMEGEEVLPNNRPIQYLFSRPRYGAGINNQLEEFWFAIELAVLLGRGIVLPKIGESITWFRPTLDRLYDYTLFFDRDVLSQLLPTITVEEWKDQCNGSLELDIFAAKKNQIMQKQYEQQLGIRWKGVPRVVVTSWTELRGKKLPDCLGVQWPREILDDIMDRHRMAPGDPPLGAAVERNAQFRLIRRHTIAAPHVIKAVFPITKKLGRYLGVHVRVGDFRKWCKGADAVKCPTDQQHAEKVKAIAAQFDLRTVFIACAPEFLNHTLDYMRRLNPHLEFHSFIPQEEPFLSHPDVVGVAEQQICADAVAFIGNAWSTWTRTVHELRFTSGKKCHTDHLWGLRNPWCVQGTLPIR